MRTREEIIVDLQAICDYIFVYADGHITIDTMLAPTDAPTFIALLTELHALGASTT